MAECVSVSVCTRTHMGNAEPWERVIGVLVVPSAGTLQGPGLLGFQWERAEP